MGTPEQVDRWYRPAVEDGVQWAFALTGPGFGSDTTLVATTAVRDGDNWVLNGTKTYCSNGASADFITVFAATDKSLGSKGIHAFAVPRDAPGLFVTKPNEDKLGVRSWLTSELHFDDCVIPVENKLGWTPDGSVVGRRQAGRGGALATLSHNRPNMAAIAVGLGQASIDLTTGLLKERRLGFTTMRWAAVQDDLELMNVSLQRARRMSARAQFLVDQGKPNPSASAAAKAYAPETVERVIRRCMQLLGPEGFSQDPAARGEVVPRRQDHRHLQREPDRCSASLSSAHVAGAARGLIRKDVAAVRVPAPDRGSRVRHSRACATALRESIAVRKCLVPPCRAGSLPHRRSAEDDAGLDVGQHLGPLAGDESGPRPCVAAPGDADEVDVLQQQTIDPNGRDLTAREADHEQATVGAQASQRVGEAVATDRIDYDVDASERLHGGSEHLHAQRSDRQPSRSRRCQPSRPTTPRR